MSDARLNSILGIAGDIDELEAEQAAALRASVEASRPVEQSWGDLIGSAIGALIPMGVGYAVAQERGAAAGALGAASTYNQSLERLQKEKAAEKASADLLYKEKKDEIKERRKDIFTLQRDEFRDADIDEARADNQAFRRSLGSGGQGTASGRPISANDAANFENLTGRKPPPGMTVSEYERELAFQRITGGGSKKLSDAELKAVTAIDKASDNITRIVDTFGLKVNQSRLGNAINEANREFEPDSGKSRSQNLEVRADTIERKVKQTFGFNSPEAQMIKELTLTARGIAQAAEAGVLTQQDVEIYYDYFLPEAFETNETFTDRLDRYQERLNRERGITIKNYGLGQRNVEGFDQSRPSSSNEGIEKINLMRQQLADRLSALESQLKKP